MILIHILTLFFILLLIYQTYLHFFSHADGLVIEGLVGDTEGLDNEYKPYDMNNPNNTLILAQQNAANIEFLKQKIAGLENMQKEVNDISLNLVTINEQMQGLIQQQQEAATQLAGNTPLVVTGTSSA